MGYEQQVVDIPRDRASFFSFVMLLSPVSFEWAKSFLVSKTWETLIACSQDAIMMSFALPTLCPEDAEVHCFAQGSTEIPCPDLESNNNNQATDLLSSSLPRGQTIPTAATLMGSPLVETDVRRSSRVKARNDGFRRPTCS